MTRIRLGSRRNGRYGTTGRWRARGGCSANRREVSPAPNRWRAVGSNSNDREPYDGKSGVDRLPFLLPIGREILLSRVGHVRLRSEFLPYRSSQREACRPTVLSNFGSRFRSYPDRTRVTTCRGNLRNPYRSEFFRPICPARPWSCEPLAMPRRGYPPSHQVILVGMCSSASYLRPGRRSIRISSHIVSTRLASPRRKRTRWTHKRDIGSLPAAFASTRGRTYHAQGHRDCFETRPRGGEQSQWSHVGTQDSSCLHTCQSGQTSCTYEA